MLPLKKGLPLRYGLLDTGSGRLSARLAIGLVRGREVAGMARAQGSALGQGEDGAGGRVPVPIPLLIDEHDGIAGLLKGHAVLVQLPHLRLAVTYIPHHRLQ